MPMLTPCLSEVRSAILREYRTTVAPAGRAHDAMSRPTSGAAQPRGAGFVPPGARGFCARSDHWRTGWMAASCGTTAAHSSCWLRRRIHAGPACVRMGGSRHPRERARRSGGLSRDGQMTFASAVCRCDGTRVPTAGQRECRRHLGGSDGDHGDSGRQRARCHPGGLERRARHDPLTELMNRVYSTSSSRQRSRPGVGWGRSSRSPTSTSTVSSRSTIASAMPWETRYSLKSHIGSATRFGRRIASHGSAAMSSRRSFRSSRANRNCRRSRTGSSKRSGWRRGGWAGGVGPWQHRSVVVRPGHRHRRLVDAAPPTGRCTAQSATRNTTGASTVRARGNEVTRASGYARARIRRARYAAACRASSADRPC